MSSSLAVRRVRRRGLKSACTCASPLEDRELARLRGALLRSVWLFFCCRPLPAGALWRVRISDDGLCAEALVLLDTRRWVRRLLEIALMHINGVDVCPGCVVVRRVAGSGK